MRLQAQAGLLFFALITATIAEGQQIHGNSGIKPPAASLQPAPVSVPAMPQRAPSLLDQPAKPAQIEISDKKLSVKADNSSLSAILRDISAKTGTKVEGLSRDQRIFGSYGPSSPREVLSALLDGLGYNVMLVGSLNNGAPRQVVLTQRTGGVTPPLNNPATRQNTNDDDDDSTPMPYQQAPPRPETITPPAENHPPAQQPGQVKTPQQLLQELQQMRQRQQQPSNPQ